MVLEGEGDYAVSVKRYKCESFQPFFLYDLPGIKGYTSFSGSFFLKE